jgi:hypothetical protein
LGYKDSKLQKVSILKFQNNLTTFESFSETMDFRHLQSLKEKFIGKLYIDQNELVPNLLADTSKSKVKIFLFLFLNMVHAIQKANTNFFCLEYFFIRLSNQIDEFSWLKNFLEYYSF